MAGQQKSAVSAFVIMAGFNLVGAVIFLVLFFLDKEFGQYYLLAAGILVLAAVGLGVLFIYFKKKLQGY